MGEKDDFCIAVMHAYIDLVDFKSVVGSGNMAFLDALRLFLGCFRIPGESQKIDRMMLKFAQRYEVDFYTHTYTPYLSIHFYSRPCLSFSTLYAYSLATARFTLTMVSLPRPTPPMFWRTLCLCSTPISTTHRFDHLWVSPVGF